MIAGPGTGKTYCLLHKALQITEEETTTADRIRVVNFTNAGVRDLRRKVETQAEYASLNPETITTFHSLALRALLRVRARGVPRPIVILDDWEERFFIDEYAKHRLGLRDIRQAKKAREDYNARWCLAREDIDDWLSQDSRRAFEDAYATVKEVLGCTTRGELTFLWWRYLRSLAAPDPSTLSVEADHLLVDEYQDLNECEHEILEILANSGVRIFAVGDPNQSIYESLRHAHPELCWTFPNRIEPSEFNILDESFRCPSAVLRLAAALMGSAGGIPDPNLSPNEGESQVLEFPSDGGEITGVAGSRKGSSDWTPARGYLLPCQSVLSPARSLMHSKNSESHLRTARHVRLTTRLSAGWPTP